MSKVADTPFAEALERLAERGLQRRLRPTSGRQGPRMRVDGHDVLMMAGSNYLDLAGDERVLAAAVEATECHGTASGGARLISGNLELFETLERDLARFLGLEAALLFSTGYMANLGVLTALAGPGDAIVSDELNHASIIDACQLSRARVGVFRHNDAHDLERVARETADARRRVLVLDGVYSMEGDVARLEELVPVARAHGMMVVLDDAHGFGVLGVSGRGSAEHCGVEVDLVIGNLGKALGSFGAFVACSSVVRDYLVNTSRSFIFTCALPPACAGAARAALQILASESWRRERLQARSERLRAGLRDAGYDTGASSTQIVPAIVGDNETVMRQCERALAAGVYVQGIRYPSVPEGSARLRFTPSCAHEPADIDQVIGLFSSLR